MKYEAIEANSSIFDVKEMCRVLGLKSQNYYRWKRQQKKQEENDGYEISEYRVRRIMRENGMYPETQRKYKPTHNGKVNGMYSKDHVKQRFRTKRKNEIWVGDITYIKTSVGWVYLAVVIDLYNREVIGYDISKHIDTELVKRVLSNAIARQGTREGLIFHSDRGCQYSSKGYREMLEKNSIISSMSRPGCPYDNSCSESFFATIKKERIYRRKYATMEEVRRDLFQYIEIFYNRKRMHSVLGYMSPVAYRLKYEVQDVA